jgi:Tfp pilus assembly protein PilF
VGWGWFLGTLVPVIGLVQVGMQALADRYVYVPFLGLAIALAWGVQALVRWADVRALPAVVGASAVALFCGWALLTARQSETWHDGFTLFENAIEQTDRNWMAHGFLASVYFGREEFGKSIAHSEEAIKYGRSMGPIRSTYGLALYETGSPERAREQFELATLQDPDDPIGYMNLGWLLTTRGDYDLALVNLMGAASKIKSNTPAYTRKMIFANWAGALEKIQRLPEAREKYDVALGIDPDFPAVLRDAARVDLQLGDARRASQRLGRALEIDPEDVEATYLLASATTLSGDTAGGAALFDRALAEAPRKVVIAAALARRLATAGQGDGAVQLLRALLDRPPPAQEEDARFVAATLRTQLAEIALERGDVASAFDELDRALSVSPDDYDANHRLAWLLATSADADRRDPERAVALAEKVVSERREYSSLATLAVSYAAAGRMSAAVETSREALGLAAQAHDARAVAMLEQRLMEYGAEPTSVSEPAQ